jgi:hypothetical protein
MVSNGAEVLMLDFDLINHVIDEATMADVLAKQRSVTSLFPTFRDRVGKVADAGGVRLMRQDPVQWDFEVHSADKNIWYQDVVKFKDLPQVIAKHAKNKMLWNKEKTGVDLRFLAQEVLEDVQIELFCSCPAFQYWGPSFILTRRAAKYTAPETRPPNIRNPRQYGAMCKHMQLVFDVLPFYAGTMSKHIRLYYMDIVRRAEREALRLDRSIKRAASTLGKKEEPKTFRRIGKPVVPPKEEEEPKEGGEVPPEEEAT